MSNKRNSINDQLNKTPNEFLNMVTIKEIKMEGIDLSVILLIVCSGIGMILCVLLVIFICLYCRRKNEENMNVDRSNIENKIPEINNIKRDTRELKVIDLNREKNKNDENIKDINDNNFERHSNALSNTNKNLSNISSLKIIEEKIVGNGSVRKIPSKHDIEIIKNFSFLEELIKSKIHEINISEDRDKGKKYPYKNVIKNDNDLYSHSENSKANNSILDKNKKDIEDFKDVSESDNNSINERQ